MAKKKNLDAKLGSWADQATLSRSQKSAGSQPAATPHRETHLLERSLIERIGLLAGQHNVTPQQLIGHLLTWSLDQVETGNYKLKLSEEIGSRL